MYRSPGPEFDVHAGLAQLRYNTATLIEEPVTTMAAANQTTWMHLPRVSNSIHAVAGTWLMHMVGQNVCASLLLLLLLLPHAPFCGGLLCVCCALPPGPQNQPHGGWPTITTSTRTVSTCCLARWVVAAFAGLADASQNSSAI
jgi:hypothetical protein